ncbi:MAG: hypothetical protein HY608_07290, partial [Planctomycetes bacterium]|nr:hypothetical protein [Planctomycetota bacterium]
ALADTLIPWLGLKVLGKGPHLHLCAVEHPGIVGACALGGIALGLLARRTWGSCSHWLHSAHILIANVAAVLFILKNVPDVRAGDALGVAAILTAAVGLTCICGDVVIPTLLTMRTGAVARPADART